MNNISANQTAADGRQINLHYQFGNTASEHRMKNLEEVVKKFNKAIDTFMENEMPKD